MASGNSASSPLMRIKSSESIHQYEIEIDNSKSKNLPITEFISSPPLSADNYDWVLDYYPQGRTTKWPPCRSFVLRLQSEAKNVIAKYTLKILAKTGNFVRICEDEKRTFSCHEEVLLDNEKFIFRNIEDQCCDKNLIVIFCKITVLGEQKVDKKNFGGLLEHIEKLWEKKERFDVTFEVEGESISAHRLILAARSSVFEATLFGHMAEAKMGYIKINDMKAKIFKALIHFIYTDKLVIDESNEDETLSVELLQDLFVAADRYALEKLFQLCEEQLAKKLSVNTVVTTLLLADQHNCVDLKKKCLEFASAPGIFTLVALTQGYLHIIPKCPSLHAELSDMVKSSPCFCKKQRAG